MVILYHILGALSIVRCCLKTIGASAFKDCYSLEYILLPSSVTSLGNFAFENCYRIKSICLNENVKYTSATIKNCTELSQNLSDIFTDMLDNCTSLPDNAFVSNRYIENAELCEEIVSPPKPVEISNKMCYNRLKAVVK